MVAELVVDVELESDGPSPGVREIKRGYKRKPASEFNDAPANMLPRQGAFYRDLIRLAQAVRSNDLPVDFTLTDGRPMRLDNGCIKIAEHAGFLAPLQNGPSGVLETVRLSWNAFR